MRAFAESSWQFVRGILKRFWLLVPAFILDPLDLLERVGVEVEIPRQYFFLALGLGLFLAATLTYHEQRTEALRLGAASQLSPRQAFEQEIRELQAEARWLLDHPDEIPSYPFSGPYVGDGEGWYLKALNVVVEMLGRSEGDRFAAAIGSLDVDVNEIKTGIAYLDDLLGGGTSLRADPA